MKKRAVIYILSLFFCASVFAQTEEPAQEGGKIQERMREYIQTRLGLSKAESEKFTPVFVRYFREFAQTHRENKRDKLILQQKIIELRIRYRTEFKQVLDEQRANKVYVYEDEFRKRAIEIIRENRREKLRDRPIRQNKVMIQRTI